MSKHSSSGTAWDAIRKQVLQRDGWQCVYCGQEANTADHIIPKAKGGTDVLTNLVACCHLCNSRKQDRAIVRQNWFNKRWF